MLDDFTCEGRASVQWERHSSNYYTVIEVKLSDVRQSEITKEPILSAMRINLGFRKRDGQTVNPLPPRSSPLMCKIVWC